MLQNIGQRNWQTTETSLLPPQHPEAWHKRVFFLHNLPGETQNAWVCSRIATENTQQSSSPYGMQTSITSQDQDQQGYCDHPSPTLPQGFHSSVRPIVRSFIRSPYQLVWCGWKHVGDKVSSYSQLMHFSGVPPSMTNPLMTPCF